MAIVWGGFNGGLVWWRCLAMVLDDGDTLVVVGLMVVWDLAVGFLVLAQDLLFFFFFCVFVLVK